MDGGRGEELLNGQNPLSVAKSICRQNSIQNSIIFLESLIKYLCPEWLSTSPNG